MKVLDRTSVLCIGGPADGRRVSDFQGAALVVPRSVQVSAVYDGVLPNASLAVDHDHYYPALLGPRDQPVVVLIHEHLTAEDALRELVRCYPVERP